MAWWPGGPRRGTLTLALGGDAPALGGPALLRCSRARALPGQPKQVYANRHAGHAPCEYLPRVRAPRWMWVVRVCAWGTSCWMQA